ncbi:MAG: metallophosphoesterase, partial [Dysgonamonadaceae bacterium]|nr:metallophosphoesterase [Dysgonamonadaceae bacterium]
MKRLLISTLLSFGCFLTSHIAYAQAVASNDNLLLTVGVISDIHNQHTLINPSSVDDVKLRGSFETVLARMKQEENLDMLIFGGDYTSDVTIPEANFNRIRELIINAGRSVFGTETKPVLYVIGNHDFEVANFDALPKPYNAGDFYAPMQADIGELDENSVFYEEADNGTSPKMKLLAAYHYVIDGFDFVVLNCGKYFFKSAWDYTYSQESVNWVKNKLEEIYADNPDKTVFLLCHMPFRDSKHMSGPDKGIFNHTATQTFKWTLAKYPNLIYLYGHDHGSDSAYIRTSTAERVTEYDSNGYAIGQVAASQSFFCLQNKADQTYLGVNDYNLYPVTGKAACSITANAGYFNVKLSSYPSGVSGAYLYIGSNGRFSLNSAAVDLRFFKVVSESGGTITAEQVTDGTVQSGAEYVITAVREGSDYAVTN